MNEKPDAYKEETEPRGYNDRNEGFIVVAYGILSIGNKGRGHFCRVLFNPFTVGSNHGVIVLCLVVGENRISDRCGLLSFTPTEFSSFSPTATVALAGTSCNPI